MTHDPRHLLTSLCMYHDGRDSPSELLKRPHGTMESNLLPNDSISDRDSLSQRSYVLGVFQVMLVRPFLSPECHARQAAEGVRCHIVLHC